MSDTKTPVGGCVEEYRPLHVARIVWDSYLPHRGFTPIAREGRAAAKTGAPARPTREGISEDMKRGYVRFDAQRAAAKGEKPHMIVLLLDRDHAVAHTSANLRGLLNSMQAERTAKEGLLAEILLIVDESFFSRNALKEIVRNLQSPPEGSPKTGIYWNCQPYSTFSFCLVDHVSVGKHVVLTPEEEQKYLTDERKSASNLPLISYMDPPIVWAGGRPGQLVRVTRNSETVGEFPVVRRIVRQSPLL